jgi:hypothetical protein
MKTFKQLSNVSTAFLMAATMNPAFADEGEMTQTRTQARERTEFNLRTPTADFGQSGQQERVMNQNQNQYQYKYMNGSSSDHSSSGQGSMNRYMQGGNAASASAMSGSMNRQSAGGRSKGGSRR